MRIALVHYWLLGMRGGEKVLEAICRIFPSADIFTLFYEPEAVSPLIRSHRVQASWLNPLRRWHRSMLPLMPMALEDLDLRGYDLVISSEAGPAKGVLTSALTRHFCYCHTPMRYLWELYPFYRNDLPRAALANLFFSPLAGYLRLWDESSAVRVGGFMANSRNVRNRIWKAYRRSARVVYPPVNVKSFRNETSRGYSLIVSGLVPDKRLDYAIRSFARSGRRLKVVGDGPEYRALKRVAKGDVEFCGWVPDAQLRDLYAHSSELIVPGEEDFGMTMVEALASGKPVVALGRGGALEIVKSGCGVLFPEPSESSLEDALRTLDAIRPGLEPGDLQQSAERFSESAFNRRFLRAVVSMWAKESRRLGHERDMGELAGSIAPGSRDRFAVLAAEAGV